MLEGLLLGSWGHPHLQGELDSSFEGLLLGSCLMGMECSHLAPWLVLQKVQQVQPDQYFRAVPSENQDPCQAPTTLRTLRSIRTRDQDKGTARRGGWRTGTVVGDTVGGTAVGTAGSASSTEDGTSALLYGTPASWLSFSS